MRSGWFLTGAVLALILTLAASCGRKTAPLTPNSPRPAMVRNIKAEVRNNIAYLSWPIPITNVEGKEMKLSDISGFRIYRAAIRPDRKRQRFRLYDIVELAEPAPSEVREGRVFWKDGALQYGQVYGYKIRAVSTRGSVSAYSEMARVTPLLSLAVPKGISATAGDSHVKLAWEPVTTRADGSRYTGFVGYNVYRGTAKGRHEERPVNSEPLRENALRDTAVHNDTTYFYIVRTVDSPALPWKESLDSEEVSATPRDMTPPGRPAGITVVPGVGRVFLTWAENSERDLDGYHIYRSEKKTGDFLRLTEKPLVRTTFTDETAKAGITYYYAISAIDKAGNEGKRSKAVKAYAEKIQ